MSLILEALKKSEAERRGQDPGPAPDGGRRRRTGGLFGGMAVIALLGAVAGWWVSRQWPEPANGTATPAPGVSETAADRGSEAEPSGPAAERAPGDAASRIARDRAPAKAVATPPTSVARTSRPATAADEAEATIALPREPATATVDSPPPAPPRLVTVAPRTARGEDGARGPRPAAPAATEVDTGAGPQPERALPRLDQLPELRAQFGDLALNMLVYSAQADARFALINLKRFREGDEIQPGLKIEQIRRDGIVLSHRGQALLLPSTH